MNAARDTRTGGVLEAMVLPALTNGGYHYETQVFIGERPNGRRHRLDVLAKDDDDNKYLISLKWQQVSGTAEQKVPYEMICLAEAIQSGAGEKHTLFLVAPDGVCAIIIWEAVWIVICYMRIWLLWLIWKTSLRSRIKASYKLRLPIPLMLAAREEIG